jgi:organic hydroperoxide reductase OsmC/OhrA
MAGRQHRYNIQVEWTGNNGTGTSGYREYARSHEVRVDGKQSIAGSSDPVFRGDRTRWNPEELLVSALAACHMLAYLHLCADAGIVVTNYSDSADGVMAENTQGGGQFTQVTLRPVVTLAAGSDIGLAKELHHTAHEQCFIASSVNFPVHCEPTVSA